ncbi:MAG: protein-disulfide reductase DsbD [Candidatus Eisenbacteria bacterium]|nr:protein-disulfide reductase DsbD [Candidatus Eisenbacteria bacterium]
MTSEHRERAVRDSSFRSCARVRAAWGLALSALLLAAGGLFAQESPFIVEGEAVRLRAEPDRAEIRFHLEVPPDHYLYRHMMSVDLLDTTALRLEAAEFPSGTIKFDPFLEEETEIYDRDLMVRALLAARSGSEFPERIRIQFAFQGCTSEFCYFPEERAYDLAWSWGEEGAKEEETRAEKGPAAAPGSFDVGERIASRGLFFTYVAVFFAGILLSFTPCVFPMIPITLSIIGARGEKGALRNFLLSLIYVLGMALTYATLGLVAATTGAMFGSILQNPWFVGGIVLLFVLLALSMFGVFELQVPSSVAVRLQRVGGGGGWIGIFLMGIVAGLVASPCVGPVLVGLLVYIAQTGSALLGFTLLFTLAMGIGVLFLAIGTFSGLIGTLPGAGDWMDSVKRVFGFLLLGVAIYFAAPLLPKRLVLSLAGALLTVAAVFFGLLEAMPPGAPAARRIARTFVLVLGAFGVVLLVATLLLPFLPLPGATGIAPQAEEIAWIPDHDLGIAEAAREGNPAVIDFTADWCAACRELEHKTYTDPAVIRESRRFTMILVDCTRSTEKIRALLAEYGVRGLPTIVFIDSSGRRDENLTVTGFMEPGPFVEILRSVR